LVDRDAARCEFGRRHGAAGQEGGIEIIGLSDRRPKDKFGIAGGYARVSSRARALHLDFQQLMGANWPLRRS
jgi:porin